MILRRLMLEVFDFPLTAILTENEKVGLLTLCLCVSELLVQTTKESQKQKRK